nr:unnamed protein product [Callosobruchus chinensis]
MTDSTISNTDPSVWAFCSCSMHKCKFFIKKKRGSRTSNSELVMVAKKKVCVFHLSNPKRPAYFESKQPSRLEIVIGAQTNDPQYFAERSLSAFLHYGTNPEVIFLDYSVIKKRHKKCLVYKVHDLYSIGALPNLNKLGEKLFGIWSECSRLDDVIPIFPQEISRLNVRIEWNMQPLRAVLAVFKSKNSKLTLRQLRKVQKVFEKMLNFQVVQYLDKYKIIAEHQQEFQKIRSANDAIAALTSKIYSAMTSTKLAIGIFVYFVKAFYIVSHPELLEVLHDVSAYFYDIEATMG